MLLRTKIFIALMVCWFAFIAWEIYPVVLLVHNHTIHDGYLAAILLDTNNQPGRALNDAKTLSLTTTGWIFTLLTLSLLVTLMAMNKRRPGTAHGSATPGGRRTVREFRPQRHFPTLSLAPLRALLPARRAPRSSSRALAPVQLGSRALAPTPPPARPRRAPAEQRLVLGRYMGREISLSQEQQQRYILLTAMIGAGKTAGPIMRNLLRECGLRSLFIADAKGELFPMTAGWLSQFYEVRIFAPLDGSRSDGYNPLSHIHSVQDALQFAECWAFNTGGGEGHGADATFWMNMVIRAINACILHLLASEPGAPFSRMAELLSQHTYEELRAVLMASKSPKAKAEANAFFNGMDRNDKLIAGMMTDLGNRFRLFLDDEACQSTSFNTIDFRAMGERPIALYLEIPTFGADLCAPLFATFIMQMWTEWEKLAAKSPGRKLPLPVEAYMDEFANLGKIYGLQTHFTTMRSMGIGLFVVLQSFSQIDLLYGPHMRKVIQTNCYTHLLLPGGGDEECEYYSRRIGDTTAIATSQTVSGGGLFDPGTPTTTTNEVSRRLYTHEELRTMEQDEMLVLPARHDAMIVKTMPYTQDREVRNRADLPYTHTIVSASPWTPPSPPNFPARPNTQSGQQRTGTWGKMPPKSPGAGNTGRVVDSDPDDDTWPSFFAPEEDDPA